jgi:hypothetical protein
MIGCVQIFLKEGLVEDEPINLKLTKLVNVPVMSSLNLPGERFKIMYNG